MEASEASTTAVLLHGFGGRGGSWDAVRAALARRWARDGAAARYRVLTPDLRGHGAAAARRPVDLGGVLADLEPVLEDAARTGPVVLGGYSLGGRVALQQALRRPDLVAGLLLVATTAGLEGEDARAARRAADAEHAAVLREEGLEAFVARWAALPLWDGDPSAARAAQAADLRAADPAALAEAVEELSPGRLPAAWDGLGRLVVPALVLAGERDARYRALAVRLVDALPDARRETVAGAGHGLVREAPGAVAAALDALVGAAAVQGD